MAEPSESEKLPTLPCSVCGRHFIKSSLDKHVPVCKKLTKMQRKVFDSGRQRAIGSDVPLNDIRKVAKEREKFGGVFPRPSTNWRERHDEFIGVVSASKQVDIALKTGAPLPPPPRTASSTMTSSNTGGLAADMVRCDCCGRSFNKHSAERHIEFCKELALRKGPATKSATNPARQATSAGKPPKEKKSALSANSAVAATVRNGTAPKPPQSSATATKSSVNTTTAAEKGRSKSMKQQQQNSPNVAEHSGRKPSVERKSQQGKTTTNSGEKTSSSSQIPVPAKRSNSLSKGSKQASEGVTTKGKTLVAGARH